MSKEQESRKIIAHNRRARFDYEFIDRYEAGLVLTGAEVKSIREAKVSLAESYIRPKGSELFWVNGHINPYKFQGALEVDPRRSRKLLLNRSELDKLIDRVERKGLTIVPVEIYLKGGRVKLEIALARGKANEDKRATIKAREADREAQKAIKNARR